MEDGRACHNYWSAGRKKATGSMTVNHERKPGMEKLILCSMISRRARGSQSRTIKKLRPEGRISCSRKGADFQKNLRTLFNIDKTQIRKDDSQRNAHAKRGSLRKSRTRRRTMGGGVWLGWFGGLGSAPEREKSS